MPETIHDIHSQAEFDALLAREPGILTIRVRGEVRLSLPRLVRVVMGLLYATAAGAGASATADGAGASATAAGARAYATAAGARASATADGAGAYATADGARAYATADGAGAYATADGAGAYATADGARASATADGAWAYATADGAWAYDPPAYRAAEMKVTLEHVRDACAWAEAHREVADEIVPGVRRRYSQSAWDCGTSCCVWGGAMLRAAGIPAAHGPSSEWIAQSPAHQEAANLMRDTFASPTQIAEACGIHGEAK